MVMTRGAGLWGRFRGRFHTVRGAMESLKPKVVRESQVNRKVKVRRWNKRKNEGFMRQRVDVRSLRGYESR